tara:strand:- start:5243 stop:5635 length:393 start_codon:yes stop_codon:yes gene_type:complete
MANRDFKDLQAAEREVKRLYLKATIGASGAPTLVAADSLGVKTIVRNGTGDYTITLGTPSGNTDKYNKLLWSDGKLLDPDAEDVRVQIDTDSISSAGTMKILTVTGGSAADPSNGATLLMVFDVKNSTVK